VSRRRIALATLFVVVVAAVATVYSYTAPKRYEATARVVVHPIPASDTTYTGIDVLHSTGDTPRDLQTAAHFFDTPDVLSTTATRLSLSPSDVAKSLEVRPLAGSNILLVVGKSSSPDLAAQIANGIVQEGISQRTARVQAQVSAVLDKLRPSKSADAQRRVVDLSALQGRPDPTLETLSAAAAPTNAAWPNRTLVIGVATLVALVLAAAFLVVPRARAALPHPAPAVDDAERVAQLRALSDREEAVGRREAAMAQRGRELQSVVDEARDATAGDTGGEVEERLQTRVAAVTSREQGLAKRAAALALRERQLAEREQELAERTSALALRERRLGEHERKLAERERELAERAAVLEPPAAPEPEPVPVAAPAPVTVRQPGSWTIQQLERVVADRGAAHPDTVEEWRYYVHFLRDYAGIDGELPSSFDALIEETFAEIL
jgi:capsular polysaccharide biosynthesis protein